MATEDKEKAYEGGAGGKFQKRLFRRTQTTPYDRPPTSLRNPNNSGWLSKVVDPAHRLITYSAHSLFSSLFCKRLASSGTKQEVRNNHHEEAAYVANNSSGNQQGPVGESDTQINCSDGGGSTELEKLLKQKTFTRSEIDRLTALMRSRAVDAPVREEEKGTEMIISEPLLPSGQKEEYTKTPALENGIENHLVVSPHVTSSFPDENVASPAELAKAYMGSRPSKVSPSILSVQTPALNEDTTLIKNENFPLKFPIMSIVPRTATRHAAVHENGFVTPRSRGRSAIYSMARTARTPYTRIYPSSILKGKGLTVEGEPSSSSQSALDHDMFSGSKQGAVKYRSSVLDNDIGSVGPIRRIRQKSNLLFSNGSSLTLSSSSLSNSRSRMSIDAGQKPSSYMQKPILLAEVKHSHIKYSEENVDDTIPSSSFPPLHSKSSEMASKILQQLDNLVSPKEKSSELRLPIVSDNSPTKLSPSALRGQALSQNLSAQNQTLNSQRNKAENGKLKLAPSNGLLPVVTTTDATNPRNQVLSSAKSVDSFIIKSVSDPPQKRRAFHMSAHEDCLDLDDDAYPNGAVSSSSPVQKEMTTSIAVIEKTTSGTEAIANENPSALSVVMQPESSKIDGKACVGAKVDAPTSITSSILDPTSKPDTVSVMEVTQTSFGFDKPASPNGSIANPPLFNFGNKVVASTELTAPDAPSKEITKSGPIFGLENNVSSEEPVADATSVNFGSNKNVDKMPPMPFTASSSVCSESIFVKFGASTDSKLGSSVSSVTVAGATNSMPKICESDNGHLGTNIDTGSSVRALELGVSSASSSLLTSPTFGHSSNQNNGSFSSPSFSSSFSSLVSNNFTSQNIFSSSSASTSTGISTAADSGGTNILTITPAIIASSNSSSSTPVVASSSSTTSFFKFGSSPVASTGLSVSSFGSEPTETKSRQDVFIGSLSSTAFGSSSAGSGIFGFSSSAMTSVNSQSQCFVFGASSGSEFGAQASFTSSFANSTQTQSVPFGSSAPSPSFGLTGNTAFPLGSSSFPSSSTATNTPFSSGNSLFPSSSPTTKDFSSGTTFGFSSSASSSAVNSVSSNGGTSSTLFGSSWQPSKSPFGSSFSSSSSSGFSFGASTASVASASSAAMFSSTSSASTPQFSFTSAAASTSLQSAFGSPNPVFTFGSAPVNNDQMSMEDSMAEDAVQATPPATSIFGQQPAPVQSNFVFGTSTPSGASPFQFGSQQSIAPQNPSFQASSSLEFNAGGSFSLGSGGGDKSGRRILRVKNKQRKK